MGEVSDASGEGGFSIDREGRGEAVAVGQFVSRSQFSCTASQFEISVHDFQRQLCDITENLPRDPGSLRTPQGVVHFAPIHHGHKQLALAVDAQTNQILDFIRPRSIFKEGHQRAGIEDRALHNLRSRLRSSSRAFSADGSPLREPRRLRMNAAVRGCSTRRFSCSTKATWVPSLIEYLRRSLEGMTSWPFVVTVEISVFIQTPRHGIRDKYSDSLYVSHDLA